MSTIDYVNYYVSLRHMEQTPVCEEIKIGQLMPLMGHLMCYVRQQSSLIYKDLGYDITPEAADALMVIQHFDGLPQKKLADILGKDKASITRLLNSLVKSNLVARVQDEEDRRIIRAHITPEGKQAFEQAFPKLQVLSESALAQVNQGDFIKTLETLSQIVGNTHVEEDCCNSD